MLGLVAIARGAHSAECAALRANVDMVLRGDAVARASDTFVLEGRGRRSRLTVQRGDFSGALSIDELRACLGPQWTETHAGAQAARRGDAWVFVRPGWPMILYVEGRSRRRLETRILIETSPPTARPA